MMLTAIRNRERPRQVPLNDETEYTGGKLVYATADGFAFPLRSAGTVIILLFFI